MSLHLRQFQCQREKTLFYYQSHWVPQWGPLRCPVCGSKRTRCIREFPPLDETGVPMIGEAEEASASYAVRRVAGGRP